MDEQLVKLAYRICGVIVVCPALLYHLNGVGILTHTASPWIN